MRATMFRLVLGKALPDTQAAGLTSIHRKLWATRLNKSVLCTCKCWFDALCSCSVKPNSNPTLPPHAVVLQIPPGNDLSGLRKHRLDFYQFNRAGGLIGLDHPADQKVFLLGHGFHGGPFGQQQFFRVERVHGLPCISRATASANSITAMA